MLDVHPPHQAAHTWKDFLIHVATICVGLLIAIGLEQSVEFFHHRYEVREIRKLLEAEREQNRHGIAIDIAMYRYDQAMLLNDLQVLEYARLHPDTPMEKLPGTLRWTFYYQPANDVVWKSAHETGVTALMPRAESADIQEVYFTLGLHDAAALELWNALGKAQQFTAIDPNPSHLSAQQMDTELSLLAAALEANHRWGLLLFVLHQDFPDFPGLPAAEIRGNDAVLPPAGQKALLAKANALTDARLAHVQAELDAANVAMGTYMQSHGGARRNK